MNRREEERKAREKEEAGKKIAALPPALFYGCMFVSALFWQYVKHGELLAGSGVWYRRYGGAFLLILLTSAIAFLALYTGSRIFGALYRDFDDDGIGWRIFRVAVLLICLAVAVWLAGMIFGSDRL